MAATDLVTEEQIDALTTTIGSAFNADRTGIISASPDRVPMPVPRTVTQAHILVTGRNSPDQQTIEIRHLDTDGVTLLNLLATVVVAAGSRASQTPASFSQLIGAKEFIVAVRPPASGTGIPPQVDIAVVS